MKVKTKADTQWSCFGAVFMAFMGGVFILFAAECMDNKNFGLAFVAFLGLVVAVSGAVVEFRSVCHYIEKN